MDRQSVRGEWNTDFAGGEYQEESLPAVKDCKEGFGRSVAEVMGLE